MSDKRTGLQDFLDENPEFKLHQAQERFMSCGGKYILAALRQPRIPNIYKVLWEAAMYEDYMGPLRD